MTARNAKPQPPADEPAKPDTEPVDVGDTLNKLMALDSDKLSKLSTDQIVELRNSCAHVAAANLNVIDLLNAELAVRPVDPAEAF